MIYRPINIFGTRWVKLLLPNRLYNFLMANKVFGVMFQLLEIGSQQRTVAMTKRQYLKMISYKYLPIMNILP